MITDTLYIAGGRIRRLYLLPGLVWSRGAFRENAWLSIQAWLITVRVGAIFGDLHGGIFTATHETDRAGAHAFSAYVWRLGCAVRIGRPLAWWPGEFAA